MPPQFKNMNELTEYLTELEKRIDTLEDEKTQLQRRMNNQKLPNTDLINQSFVSRAFAVWGHFMTANVIIGFIGGIFYVCIIMGLFGTMYATIASQFVK